MTTVSRKYQAKQKLARKRLSKKRSNNNKRSNNKKNGGAGAEYSPETTTDGDKKYSPEATTEGDKIAETYITQIMGMASKDGEKYENNKPGYDKYWLEEIIPGIRHYLKKQKDQNINI